MVAPESQPTSAEMAAPESQPTTADSRFGGPGARGTHAWGQPSEPEPIHLGASPPPESYGLRGMLAAQSGPPGSPQWPAHAAMDPAHGTAFLTDHQHLT